MSPDSKYFWMPARSVGRRTSNESTSNWLPYWGWRFQFPLQVIVSPSWMPGIEPTMNRQSFSLGNFNFTTENLKGKIDFSNQEGSFKSNESFTVAKFPKNLYVSYLDKFDWSITNDLINIESSPQIDSTASKISSKYFLVLSVINQYFTLVYLFNKIRSNW